MAPVVLDRKVVERRLLELDAIAAELEAQEDEPPDAAGLETDLSRRWRLERGLLAAANVILDIASHLTAGHFAVHPDTYEGTLRELATRGVLEQATYDRLRGLGGFRNVLAHEYLDIDVSEVVRWRTRLLETAPDFIRQVTEWLETVED